MNLTKALEREAMREESRIRLETFRQDRKDAAITSRAAKTLLAEPESAVESPEAPAAPVIEAEEPWVINDGEVVLRPDHVALSGDFSSVVRDHFDKRYGPSNDATIGGHWLRRRRAQLGLPERVDIAELQIRVNVLSYGPDGCEADAADFILTPDFCVPPGISIRRGALGELSVLEDGTEVLHQHFFFADANALDLIAAKAATHEEATRILNPPPVPEPPYIPPTYTKLSRQPEDSRLGFTVGAADEEIKMPAIPAVWKAFHLPSTILVGRVDVFLDGGAAVDIFNPQGEKVLHANSGERFDEVRLERGDYLVVLTGCSGSLGKGQFDPEHAGVFSKIPERPLLDELLANPPEVPVNFATWPQKPMRIAMPRIKFS